MDNRMKVVFIGSFGSGKYTLINALLHREALPTDFLPLHLARKELSCQIKEIACQFIEMPLHEAAESKEVFLQADAIVFVMNGSMFLNRDESEFISLYFMMGGCLQNTFFVVTNWNLVCQHTKSVEKVKELYQKRLEKIILDKEGRFDSQLYKSRVFFVDAHGSEHIRTMEGERELELTANGSDEETGVPEFEENLYCYIKDRKGSHEIEERIRRLSSVIDKLPEGRKKEAFQERIFAIKKRFPPVWLKILPLIVLGDFNRTWLSHNQVSYVLT